MTGYLTRYEKAHIIGIRMLQLQHGAMPVSNENVHNLSIFDIAERDIKSGEINYVLKRKSYDTNNSSFVRVLPNYMCETIATSSHVINE